MKGTEGPLASEVLRVAHIINEPMGCESASGVQRAVHFTARAQADCGQAVAVFSRTDGMHSVGSGAIGEPSAESPGSPVSASSRRRSLLRPWLERSLLRTVLEWQPDVVHFHSIHIPENVALAAELRRAGVPYCVSVHGGLFEPARRRSRLQKAVFTALFERAYLNGARFVHALSPGEADVLRRHGVATRIVIAPNGIPSEAWLQSSQPDALFSLFPALPRGRIFIFVGRLDVWHKGLDLLVGAFATAPLQDAGLVLVGPDWRGSRRKVTTLVQRLGVSDRVVFSGPVYGQDLINLMAAADVFVQPSRWEGVSLSVLTAAGAGKACLITDVADPLGELGRSQAAIVVPASLEGVRRGLNEAMSLGRDELRAMGERARRVAERQFTWRSTASRLVQAYRNALTAPQVTSLAGGS